MVLSDVKKEIQERYTGPFFGPFLVSWCLWNWQIVFLAISGEKWADKVAGVKQLSGGACVLLFLPLLTSVGLTIFGAVASSAMAYALHRIYLIRDAEIAKSERLRGDTNALLPTKQSLLCFRMVGEIDVITKAIDATRGAAYADAESAQRTAVEIISNVVRFFKDRIGPLVTSNEDLKYLQEHLASAKMAVDKVTGPINAIPVRLAQVTQTLAGVASTVLAIAQTDAITVNRQHIAISDAVRLQWQEVMANKSK